MFIFIVSLSALFIAGCAAFFSIKGLMLLFAGSAFSVAVMAAALELGKLVAASFLHRNWSATSWLLKLYLCLAVFVLMGITSMGIFGFLTSAYQLHSSTVKTYEADIQQIEAQKKSVHAEIESNATRVESLTALRKDQEERVKASGNYKAPREQAYKAIAEANQEIAIKEKRQLDLRAELKVLESQLAENQKALATKTDIGSFKFIADLLNRSVDETVGLFILALVFVFDPLAVTLVLALNQLVEQREKKRNVLVTPQHVQPVALESSVPEAEGLVKAEPSIEPKIVLEAEPEKVEIQLTENLVELSVDEKKIIERYRNSRKLNPQNNSIVNR
jgi:hypothetical protein